MKNELNLKPEILNARHLLGRRDFLQVGMMSGLGLALTGKIIEQHGGQMTLDSTVGEGTTVRFTLPFDPDVEQAEQAQAAIPEGWLG